MVVDASAILAILLKEPDADVFKAALLARGGGIMSPINYWEVLVRAWESSARPGTRPRKPCWKSSASTSVRRPRMRARAAARVFERFGKRSAAGLNLGDCFAYALAAREGDGLLYKGDDFGRTDATSALA
ncbi:MAG: type II toxin-antitoxin system VapC family toxin [Caulobacteraceae bacterium]